MVISHSEALCGSLTALRLANGSSGDKHVVKMYKNCISAWSYCWHNMSNQTQPQRKSFLSQIKKWGVTCLMLDGYSLPTKTFLSLLLKVIRQHFYPPTAESDISGAQSASTETGCFLRATDPRPMGLALFCFYRPITPLATWRVQQKATFKRVNIVQ